MKVSVPENPYGNEILGKTFNIDSDDMKMRRGGSGSAGLFAFPRVGRRDSSMVEFIPWDTYEEYDIGN